MAQSVTPMIVPMVTIAISQFQPVERPPMGVVMLLTAVGASIMPMMMTIGPVTTGGKNERIFSAPKMRTSSASTTYRAPATTMPPVA